MGIEQLRCNTVETQPGTVCRYLRPGNNSWLKTLIWAFWPLWRAMRSV